MGRLVVIVAIVMAAGAIVAAALSLARRTAQATGQQIAQAQPGGALMQKTSYILLVSLILYVSLWGGA